MGDDMRCTSVSQKTGYRCQEPRKHRKRNPEELHRHGIFFWGKVKATQKDGDSLYQAETNQFNAARTSLEEMGDRLLINLREEFARADAAEQTMHSMCTVDSHDGCLDPPPLDEWWRQLSEQEISDTVPKAIEYGATDLIDIGSQLGRFMKRDLTDAQAAELGCWFYLVGKMGRATSALERGEWPSDDTIKDTGIYIKMIQRIRSAGSWPGQEMDSNGE
jgi:hypothetical protein